MKFIRRFTVKRSQSTISEGSLEGGELDGKAPFSRTLTRSGDEWNMPAMPAETRTRRPTGEADGRILVSRAIEQEVEIREDLVDDKSTKHLIERND